MPDIAMCQNGRCLTRTTCFRYTARPSQYQCYATFSPGKTKTCEYYIKDTRMKTDQQILDEAIEWVKAINKYFKIKQKIIVKLCYDKKSEDFFALTDRYEDAAEPYVIHLYPNHFRKGNRLFRVMYHEMVHILFHPLVGHLPNNTKLGKIEEAIVEKLERFAQRLSELKDETKKS